MARKIKMEISVLYFKKTFLSVCERERERERETDRQTEKNRRYFEWKLLQVKKLLYDFHQKISESIGFHSVLEVHFETGLCSRNLKTLEGKLPGYLSRAAPTSH